MTAVSTPARGIESGAAGEVREQVRAALEKGRRLRILGAGTWLDAGRPVRANARLSLQAHAGIVEYVPGDLTITALAGTPLAELERATSAERQWLPLDPFGVGGGTLGATIASASAGPLAHGFGGVRDNVLGIEVVTGRGEIVRAGGRVVKNVAGFDLTRLFTGAWGTLGVITEVSVRLRALPQVDETYAIAVDDRPDSLKGMIAELRVASVAPLAMELISPCTPLRVAAPTLLVRLGGNATSVRAQRSVLATFGDAGPTSTDVWRILRTAEPAAAIVVRLSTRPSRVADVWTQAREAVAGAEGALLIASIGRGIVRCIVPEAAHDAARRLASCDATVIFERLPAGLWSELAPSPVNDRLSRSVKDRFDPSHVLNPGLLG